MFFAVREEKAFTLIEMLIVLFVIGALSLILVPNLTGAGEQAQNRACEANKKLILSQAEAHYLENGHKYPTEIAELLSKKYLKEEPVCPANPALEDPYYFVGIDGDDEGTGFNVRCRVHDDHED